MSPPWIFYVFSDLRLEIVLTTSSAKVESHVLTYLNIPVYIYFGGMLWTKQCSYSCTYASPRKFDITTAARNTKSTSSLITNVKFANLKQWTNTRGGAKNAYVRIRSWHKSMSGSHVKISCHDPVQPSEVSPEDQEICLSSDLASRGPRGSRGPRDAKSMLWQISRSERKEVYFVKLSVSSSSIS